MKRFVLLGLILAAALLSACGVKPADVALTVVAAETNAVATVNARFTQIALLTPSATNTPVPTATPAVTNTLAVPPTVTSAPAGASAGTSCNLMGFVSDVTVSDGEQIAAGTTFTKTWRLSNDGTCTWDTTYSVAFFSGDQMSGPATQLLTASVAPGAESDISVDLVAPSTSGTYSSFWVLRTAAGENFGSFYVEIKVP
ncbi:MAG: NBR1-Ig-like domain-containing protein [Chloroflexi bacterium]|nr:NBR1-Ig-like domain-containing protein [Chloroflexota bacterium]